MHLRMSLVGVHDLVGTVRREGPQQIVLKLSVEFESPAAVPTLQGRARLLESIDALNERDSQTFRIPLAESLLPMVERGGFFTAQKITLQEGAPGPGKLAHVRLRCPLGEWEIQGKNGAMEWPS
jgi:hypothetical protein